jgi:hypothetical protein
LLSEGVRLIQGNHDLLTFPFLGILRASVVNQDAAHGRGRGGIEVVPIYPIVFLMRYQTKIGLIY